MTFSGGVLCTLRDPLHKQQCTSHTFQPRLAHSSAPSPSGPLPAESAGLLPERSAPRGSSRGGRLLRALRLRGGPPLGPFLAACSARDHGEVAHFGISVLQESGAVPAHRYTPPRRPGHQGPPVPGVRGRRCKLGVAVAQQGRVSLRAKRQSLSASNRFTLPYLCPGIGQVTLSVCCIGVNQQSREGEQCLVEVSRQGAQPERVAWVHFAIGWRSLLSAMGFVLRLYGE